MTDQKITLEPLDEQPTLPQRLRGQNFQLAAGILSRTTGIQVPSVDDILAASAWINGDDQAEPAEETPTPTPEVMHCGQCGGEHDLEDAIAQTLRGIKRDATRLAAMLDALGFPIQAADLLNVVERPALADKLREQVRAASREAAGLKRLLAALDNL